MGKVNIQFLRVKLDTKILVGMVIMKLQQYNISHAKNANNPQHPSDHGSLCEKL